jgi:GxxExxY protein
LKCYDPDNPVNPANLKMKHEEISHKIIGAAYQVFNKLGFGFLESVYRKAMIIELHKTELKVDEEKPLKVYYDDHVVGDFYVDLFVEEEIVVELKSVQRLAIEHEVQLVNYLNGLKKDVGLLINFGPSGVKAKRKYRSPGIEGKDIFRQDRQDQQDV